MADEYAAEQNKTPVQGSILKLDILGTSFTITAEEDEAYLNKVLTQYRAAVKNTQNISGISNPLNVAVLTGFLLCDEINKMKQSEYEVTGEAYEVEKRTMRLIAALDKVLKNCADE
ncbi:MAG: cell division protein ZapA [Treponema sp.]|nr:cell division protein ZapA [Treponema sp.]